MIEIKIEGTEDMYITSDAHNFILSKHTGYDAKTGRKQFRGISYHRSIDSVLESYLNSSLKQSDAKTIKELLDVKQQLMIHIRDTFSACKAIGDLKIEKDL